MAYDQPPLPAGQPQAGVNPVDPNLYLSTPEGYATPEQLQAARAYAQALQKSSITSPVRSWQQGVSNMVQALVGGNLQYQQGQRQARNAQLDQKYFGGTATTGTTDRPVGPQSAPFGELPALDGGAGKSSTNGGGATNADAAGITKNESGGKYDAVGPTVHGNDHAYGRYQVLGANIPVWTKQVLGRSLTPQEFLANPLAQDTVFRAKFGEYRAKYGPQGASRAWFAGEGNMNNPNAKDNLGTTVAQYEQNFDKTAGLPPSAVAGGTGGMTHLAFNGKSLPANPLSDMNAFAGGQGGPGGSPGPLNGGWDPHPTLPPDSIPHVPIYSREQMLGQLSRPGQTPDELRAVVANYMQQFQPIQMKVTGGSVLINRMNPTQQKFIPDVEKATKEYPGGFKTPAPYILGPYGGSVTYLPGVNPPPPGAPAPAAPAAPAPAGGGPLPFAPTGGPTGGPAAPSPAAPANGAPMPPIPGSQGAITPPPGGPQVASLEPTAGVGEAAKPAAATPPVAAAAATGGPAAGAPGAPPASPVGPRLAGLDAAPPAGISKQDSDTINFFNNMAVEQERRKGAATESSKMFAKQYNDMNEASLKVQNEMMPRLQRMQAMLSDPRADLYTGFGADVVMNWQKVKNAWGALTGDKSLENEGASNQLFRKDAAQSVLDALKPATQGTGQVRLAEIHLLERAAASPYNTIAANRAIVEIAMRAAKRLQYFQDMADDYASGNAVVDPLDPKHVLVPANVGSNGEQQPRNGIDFGYRKALSQFIKDHPAFTPEETKNYDKLFDADKNAKAPKEGEAPAATGTGAFKPPADWQYSPSRQQYRDGSGNVYDQSGQPLKAK